jgi:hypothetical protein
LENFFQRSVEDGFERSAAAAEKDRYLGSGDSWPETVAENGRRDAKEAGADARSTR